MAKPLAGREFIEKGRQVLAEMYGEDHPIKVKYFAFQSLQESIEEKIDALKLISEESFAFAENLNGPGESLFMLEVYHERVSVMSETGEVTRESIKETMAKMEAICTKLGLVSHYLAQVKTLLALNTFNKNALELAEVDFEHPLERKRKIAEEPIAILEECLVDTMRQVSIKDLPKDLSWYTMNEVPLAIRTHPFLDRTLFQLGRKNIFVGDFVKAQSFLDQLIMSREHTYGEGSFNLIKPIETIAQVFRLQNQPDQCQVIIKQCLDIISDLLGEER